MNWVSVARGDTAAVAQVKQSVNRLSAVEQVDHLFSCEVNAFTSVRQFVDSLQG
jgi:hypothetical protein